MTTTKTYNLKSPTMINSILSIFLAVITAGGVGYGFYYNTNNKLETHDQQIDNLEVSVKKLEDAINDNNVNLAVQANELHNITKSIERIEDGQAQIIELLKN